MVVEQARRAWRPWTPQPTTIHDVDAQTADDSLPPPLTDTTWTHV